MGEDKKGKLKNIGLDILFMGLLVGMVVFLILTNSYIRLVAGDTGDGAYSIFAGLAQTIHNGELPLWNPSIWGGMTAVGHSTMQAFYPVNYLLLNIFYNQETGYLSYYMIPTAIIINISLIACGLYVLFNVLGFKKYICFATASLVAFSGGMLHTIGWIYIFTGISYLPFLLAFTILALKEGKRNLKYCIVAGFVMGMSGLASTSHGILINILVFSFLYFSYIFTDKFQLDRFKRATFRCFLIGFIGIGLMSISLLPFVEFLKSAYRCVDGGVSTTGLDVIQYSDFTKDKLTALDLMPLFGGYTGWIAIGLPLCIFVVIGIFTKCKNNQYIHNFAMVLFVFTFTYSFGVITPRIMYYVPFYNAIREPFLYAQITVIALAIIGGYGFNYLINTIEHKDTEDKLVAPKMMILVLGSILFYYFTNTSWSKKEIVIGLLMILFFGLYLFRNKIKKNKIMKVILIFMTFLMTITDFWSFRDMFNVKKYTAKEAADLVSTVVNKELELLDTKPNDSDAFRVMQWCSYPAYPANIWSIWGMNETIGYMNPMYEKTNINVTNTTIERIIILR